MPTLLTGGAGTLTTICSQAPSLVDVLRGRRKPETGSRSSTAGRDHSGCAERSADPRRQPLRRHLRGRPLGAVLPPTRTTATLGATGGDRLRCRSATRRSHLRRASTRRSTLRGPGCGGQGCTMTVVRASVEPHREHLGRRPASASLSTRRRTGELLDHLGDRVAGRESRTRARSRASPSRTSPTSAPGPIALPRASTRTDRSGVACDAELARTPATPRAA